MANLLYKPYKVNFINGIILVFSGLISYFLNPAKPHTALIGPLFGVLFIILTPMLRKKVKWVSYLMAIFILLLFIAIIQVLFKEPLVLDRRTFILTLMSVSCFISLLSFIISFTKK